MNQSLLFQTEPCRLPGYPAKWSECQAYRYTLWRRWTEEPMPPYIAWICLNPSTATEETDDPTLRRVMGFTRDWGYEAMCMLNLFAFRATDPSVMKAQQDAIGDDADFWLINVACNADKVICAWGTHGAHQRRDKAVLALLRDLDLNCLALTKEGHPQHPLYASGNLQPKLFRPATPITAEPTEDD